MFSENVPYSLDNVKIIHDIHIDFTTDYGRPEKK